MVLKSGYCYQKLYKLQHLYWTYLRAKFTEPHLQFTEPHLEFTEPHLHFTEPYLQNLTYSLQNLTYSLQHLACGLQIVFLFSFRAPHLEMSHRRFAAAAKYSIILCFRADPLRSSRICDFEWAPSRICDFELASSRICDFEWATSFT